jgi:hypothetical protein
MKPIDILVGRMTLQGIATAELVYDLNQKEGDTLSDAFDIGWYVAETMMIWNPYLKPGFIGAAVRTTAGSTVVSTVLAPVAAGAMIGAVGGTVIANEIWGEEGAQTALGFYSLGMLPGTEAPELETYKYIFKPTEPGGPTSAYDVVKAGWDLTVLGARRLWSKRPTLRPKPWWKKPLIA